MYVSGFFTKQLQGALFKKFRDVIMGYKHITSLSSSPSKERAENLSTSNIDGSDDNLKNLPPKEN